MNSKTQKSASGSNKSQKNAATKDAPKISNPDKIQDCSSGVCSVEWKPSRPAA